MTTPICTLTDFISWFTCVQAHLPFGEVTTVVVFVVTFIVLKNFNLREALTGAGFLATVYSGALLGMGVINPLAPIVCIIITALSAVFLQNQNNPF